MTELIFVARAVCVPLTYYSVWINLCKLLNLRTTKLQFDICSPRLTRTHRVHFLAFSRINKSSNSFPVLAATNVLTKWNLPSMYDRFWIAIDCKQNSPKGFFPFYHNKAFSSWRTTCWHLPSNQTNRNRETLVKAHFSFWGFSLY